MSRDSIERLCDDHLEDILQHLCLRDKFKFECVSQQWRRCLYNRQKVLIIDGSDAGFQSPAFDSLNNLVVKTRVDNVSNRINVLRKDSFELVLKKCRTIKKLVIIGCECDNEVLHIIAHNCPNVEDIECELIRVNPRDNCLLEFGQRLGSKLKKFRFTYFQIEFEIIKSFLNMCSKLESINCDILEAVVDQRPDFLPKLKNLRVRVRPTDETQFEILEEKYSKCVKSLQSLAIYGSSRCFPAALRHIAAIDSLKSLTFDLSCDINANQLVTEMQLLAQKLVNLRTLEINSMIFISDQFFATLTHFTSLSKLVVNQNIQFTKTNSNISVAQLSGCPALQQLAINGFNITEHFFEDISESLPQLQSIEFSLMTDTVITDRLFRMFQSLQKLEKFCLALTVNKSKKVNKSSIQSAITQLVTITDNGLSQLILSAPKLRIIGLKSGFMSFVGQKTLNAIKSKAMAHRKWNFVLKLSSDYDLSTQWREVEAIEHHLQEMPNNVSIDITTTREWNKVHN